ncbi:c-type cytochrome [Polaribacter porphyrae]|nr:cytochrome c [Polaribacter porphyrae]
MINFQKTKPHFFLLSIGILFASCLSNVDEVEELDPCDAITFSVDVKPIIDSNCIQCHGTGGNFPNLTTYTGVSTNATIVKTEIVSKRMPQGGSLSDAEIQAISCWVDAGALNN